MWWKAIYRDDAGKQHLYILEADNKEEALVIAEMGCLKEIESIEKVDEEKFVSPLLSKVKPL